MMTTIKEVLQQLKETKEQQKEEPIEEKVEKHDTLNPKLFEGEHLRPEIKEAALKIADRYAKTLEDYQIPFKLKDLVLVGSNASYNYNDQSDLDLHLIADISEVPDEKLATAVYQSCAGLFNKNYSISFYDIPVEIYVETTENPVKINGVYSVMQDKWLKEPIAQDIPELDEEAFNKLFAEWKARCDQMLNAEPRAEEPAQE